MERPIIYQVLPRLLGAASQSNTFNGSIEENGCGKLNHFNMRALKSIRNMGFNYIWYTGVIEHATCTDYSRFGIQKDNPVVVKGKAGSPYAIKDYYDIDPDLAEDVPNRMKEFEALIARTHKAGMKMIIDFVPNHVARQYHSDAHPEGVKDLGEDDNTTIRFSKHNNFYYIVGEQLSTDFNPVPTPTPYHEIPAKATGNDCFSSHPGKNDWYETVKLNYGVDYQWERTEYFHDNDDLPDTWHKMLDILRFWATKGVDGFRCDMAEMVPCQFWGWAISQIKSEHPGIIFIAEVYNPWEYRNYIYNGHFDYLYDKVGLYDTLRGVVGGDSASKITQCWQAVDDISDHMLNFLENHDEQRLASRFFAGNPLCGRPAMIVSALMRHNPFMLYAGQELGVAATEAEGFSGEDGRTTIFDYWTLDEFHRWNNNGMWNTTHLTKEEKSLRTFYSTLLNLCNGEKAISEGEFFDVMYANYDNTLMDTNHQYAFIRKHENEMILAVSNFEDKDLDTAVIIPKHAFDYLNLPSGNYSAIDLLSGKTIAIQLMPDSPIGLKLEALNGLVLKFCL